MKSKYWIRLFGTLIWTYSLEELERSFVFFLKCEAVADSAPRFRGFMIVFEQLVCQVRQIYFIAQVPQDRGKDFHAVSSVRLHSSNFLEQLLCLTVIVVSFNVGKKMGQYGPLDTWPIQNEP